MILAFATSVLINITGVATASENKLLHNCPQSIYCGEYYHYDWWEVEAADGFTRLSHIGYSDPCEDKKIDYALPQECNYTGKPFQYHNWTLGVVQLMPDHYGEKSEQKAGPVASLAIGIFRGVQGKQSQHELSVTGFACKEYENCISEYSFVQTSAPGYYTDNQIAIDMGYYNECEGFLVVEEGEPCEKRRLWGFEGEPEK